MRTRIVKDGVYQWSDNQECAVVQRSRMRDARAVDNVGGMVPFMVKGRVGIPTNATLRHERDRKALGS